MISDKTRIVFLVIAGFLLFLAACGKEKEEKAAKEVVRPIQKKDPGAASESMVVRRREALDQSRAQIDSAQAAVDTARDELGYATLRAPFGGVVSKRYVDNYQEVRAKEPIVSLDNVSSVEVLVDVPELIVATFKESGETQAVAEFAAAPGKQYPLTIQERAMRADPQTQTYQVVFRMPQPNDINVLPGMTATVTGNARMREETKGVFIVPAIALVADTARNANVWIVDKGTSQS